MPLRNGMSNIRKTSAQILKYINQPFVKYSCVDSTCPRGNIPSPQTSLLCCFDDVLKILLSESPEFNYQMTTPYRTAYNSGIAGKPNYNNRPVQQLTKRERQLCQIIWFSEASSTLQVREKQTQKFSSFES